MIDVLLVIIIFLMLTTTYSKSELQINLPSADVEKKFERSNEINVAVSASGQYVLQRRSIQFKSVASLAEELRRPGGGTKGPIVVTSPDNNATHHPAIRGMDPGRQAGDGRGR